MYYYIVDPQQQSQRSFERVQRQLYSSLSDYRVGGEMVRITGLRPMGQLVESALAKQVKTLVAIGNDETLHELINLVRGHDIVIGYIPLRPSELATYLGLPSIDTASKSIAMRRTALIDVGAVNDYLFLSRLSFGLNRQDDSFNALTLLFRFLKGIFEVRNFEIKLLVDNSYQINNPLMSGTVINSRIGKGINPADGKLDLALIPPMSRYKIYKYRKLIAQGLYEQIPGSSFLHIRKLEILGPEGLPLAVGNKIVAKAPATIEIIPQAVRMIVGKDRIF